MLKAIWCRTPILYIEAIQLAWRPIAVNQQRFRVGECSSIHCRHEIGKVHATLGLQSAPQFKSLAVFTGKSDRINSSNTQRHQVVDDGSSPARLRANVGNVMDSQAGFDRCLLFPRVDLEVAI